MGNDNNQNDQPIEMDSLFGADVYEEEARQINERKQELHQNEIIEELNQQVQFSNDDYDNLDKEREELKKKARKQKEKEKANRRKANGFNVFVRALLVVVIGVVIFYLLNSVEVLTDLDRKVNDNVVNYHLEVNNIMSFAWVRVRFDIPELPEDYLDEHIELADNWKKYGDWYYYLGRVEPRSNLTVIESTSIDLNDFETEEINLEVEAEALSYLLNKPNFAEDNPWNDTKIHLMIK